MTYPGGTGPAGPRVHPLWHLVPAAFVGELLLLGVRSLATDDVRFGWGMFREAVVVDADYAWVLRDGTLRPHWPGSELRGPGRILDGRPDRIHTYGRGAVRAWVAGYARWRARHDPPPDAVAFRAVVDWRVNRAGPRGRDVFEVAVDPGSRPATGP